MNTEQKQLLEAAKKAREAMGRLRMGMGNHRRKTIPMEAVAECLDEAQKELNAAITATEQVTP